MESTTQEASVKAFTANVLIDNALSDLMPVGSEPKQLSQGSPLVALYGDRDGLTVLIAAEDLLSACNKIEEEFHPADAFVDDIGECADQPETLALISSLTT
jgi:hypothetical protein